MSNDIAGTFNNAFGLLGVDKDLANDFTIWQSGIINNRDNRSYW